MIKVTAVTGNVERHGCLTRLIKSIIDRTHIPWELIVMDASAEPYDQEEHLGKEDPRIHIIHDHPPCGMAKSYNKAFRSAAGEWVTWFNDDAEVLHDCLDNAVAFMEKHKELIGMGAMYWKDFSPDIKEFQVHTYWGLPYANFGILSKQFGDTIGWFDEDLPMYGSDNSIAFRVLHAGKGVVGIGNALVMHYRTQDSVRAGRAVPFSKIEQTLKEKYVDNGGLEKMRNVQKKVEHLDGPGQVIL